MKIAVHAVTLWLQKARGWLTTKDCVAAYVILAVTLLGHGLWLINDVIAHEDWVVYPYLKAHDFKTMWTWIAWFNCHAGFVPYGYLALFSNVILVSRFTTVFLVWAAGHLTYLLGSRFTRLGRQESLLMALVSVTYPANMVLHLPGEIWYPFYLTVFLFAAFLGLRAESLTGWTHWLLRGAALFLFFLAFSVGSLLVFYAPFIVLHFLYCRAASAPSSWFQSAKTYLVRHGDYLVVPVVYWSLKTAYATFFPTAQYYNTIRFEPSVIFIGYQSFQITIQEQLKTFCRPRTFAVSAVLAGIATLAWYWRYPQQQRRLQSALSYVNLALFGVLLFVCATLPYIVVCKFPGRDTEDWNTRLCMLVGQAMAVLIVAAAGIVFKFLYVNPKWNVVLVGAVVLSCCWVRNNHCVKYQAYGIRYWSLRAKLQTSEEARAIHVWKVFPRAPGMHEQLMPDYCWPFYFREIYGGGLDRYAFADPHPKSWAPEPGSGKVYADAAIAEVLEAYWKYGWFHNFQAPPPDAPQGIMIIDHGPVRSNWKLALRYWYCKMWDTEKLPEFLHHATEITLSTKEAADAAMSSSAGK